MRSTHPVAAALAAALALSACSLFFTRPDVRIAEVGLVSMGLSGATARVVLRVDNPNGYDLRGEALRYSLSFRRPGAADGDEWSTLAEGSVDREVLVPEHDSALIPLEVPFSYSELGAAAGALLREGRLDYRVRGDVRFGAPVGSVNVPFDSRGTLEP